jgi:hypothetical protein
MVHEPEFTVPEMVDKLAKLGQVVDGRRVVEDRQVTPWSPVFDFINILRS